MCNNLQIKTQRTYHWFNSPLTHFFYGRIAQLVEQDTHNVEVGGS